MRQAPFDLLATQLPKGTALLEASAGTGKTYTLTGIVLRLLLERRVERLDQVLVVTFTVAATEELKTRLRDGLARALAACEGKPAADPFFQALGRHGVAGARVLRTAIADFDRLGIATIHGFCKRLLEEAAFASGTPFRTEFTEDEIPLLRTAAQDAFRRSQARRDPLTAAVLHSAQISPESLVRDFRLWARHPDVVLNPRPEPVPQALAAAAAALATAHEQFDEQPVGDALAQLPFKKNENPFGECQDQVGRMLARQFAADPVLALDTAANVAPLVLEPLLLKGGAARLRHPFFAACGPLRAAVDTAARALHAELLAAMATALADCKASANVFTFTDLLLRVQAALHDPDRRRPLLDAVRARWQVALIDEFQDTDPVQYEVFATCFHDRPLLLVGDPKQSIYGFRGADVHSYLAARTAAEAAWTLPRNHRSHPDLVAAVSCLFARSLPFVDAGIAMPAVTAACTATDRALLGCGQPVFCWRFVAASGQSLDRKATAEQRIIADVTAECVHLLGSGVRRDDRPLRAGDIAVLTRTNAQAVAVQETLRAAGVHSAIGKAGDVYETVEIQELERLLLALTQLGNMAAARALFATRLYGLTAADLQQLDADDQALEEELVRLQRWRRLWLWRGFVVMIEQAFAELSVRTRFLLRPDGERLLTNYLQVVELLHAAEQEFRLSPEGLVQWLEHERQHQQEIDYRLRELRLESDADAVQILTVHGAKGLEYDVVFCPFLWDGRPTGRRFLARTPTGHELVLAGERGTPAWCTAEADRLAEDLRLCYVAVTRAARRCYVHWGQLKGAGSSALGWLLHGPLPPLAADWQETWYGRSLRDMARWRDELHAFCARSGGSMMVTEVPPAPLPPPRLTALPPARSRPPRHLPHRTFAVESVHSFSSLVAPDQPADPIAVDTADPEQPAAPVAAVPAVARGIFAFARGARAGLCLHDILEHLDLQAVGQPAARALVATTLERHGLLATEAHDGELDPVADTLAMLAATAGAHLPGEAVPGLGLRAADLPLALLCSGPRAAEWQFHLRLGRTSVAGLCAAFAEHGQGRVAAYAARLRELPAASLQGYLTGFADLVAGHRGCHFVLDWKSNHLGCDPAAYEGDALWPAMQDHDYVLQYHLYLLALHRHLRARRPDYDYDRHCGGAVYVFLRGTRAGTASGIYADRPPLALVLALDRWAEGGSP